MIDSTIQITLDVCFFFGYCFALALAHSANFKSEPFIDGFPKVIAQKKTIVITDYNTFATPRQSVCNSTFQHSSTLLRL